MATITVAAGATQLSYTGTMQPVVQNLGPGLLFLGATNANLLTEGVQLPVGAVYEFPAVVQDGAGAVWVQASGGDCDVRTLNVG
jgi:hypothetical protein